MWVCSDCKKEQQKPETRMPTGWKRQGDTFYCAECWRRRYILRAVTIPVVSPVELTWDQFGKALREQWALITQASNWMLTQMYIQDVRREPLETKLKPMPRVYLYPEARKRFPDLPSLTVAALEQTISKKYRARRYDLIWTSKVSLPTYRYPTPFPVPNQGWSVTLDNGRPLISARIGDQRVHFYLRSGHQFRRQMAGVKQLVEGEAVAGELALYRQGKSVMCKMVAWLPRRAADQIPAGTLMVRTDPESLLIALNAKDEKIWNYNGDQARRWIAKHRRMLQRLSDDSKAERRPVPPFTKQREAATLKFRDRLSSLTHQVAAMLAGYAQRRKFAQIQYDDSPQPFCPEFPWFQLRQKLKEKCDAAGIELLVKPVSTDTVEELSPPPADA